LVTTVIDVAESLAAAGGRFYGRGWVLGTSGNFSVVVSSDPLELLMTASGAHEGRLTGSDLLRVDQAGRVRGETGKPSAEAALHLEIVRLTGARAVLHTHSVWATVLSQAHLAQGGIAISGYEMLKGLAGNVTHTHREWVPVLENDQDMTRLAARLHETLLNHPSAHAVLLAGHGLYTWGASLDEAERHVEILEFLFEVIGRGRPHGDRDDVGPAHAGHRA